MKLPWRRNDVPLGQSMVEFALVLPIFALFLVIAIDFGRVYYSYIEINNAAREAAAYGAILPTDSVGITNKAKQETNVQGQQGESPIVITQTCKDALGNPLDCSAATGGSGPGNTITVSVSEAFSFLTPLVNSFLGNNFVMRTNATATVLGYAASDAIPPTTNCSTPIPTFTAVVTSGRTVHVDPTGSVPNSGVCNISGYNWSWGDTATSVGNATGDDHTYAVDGTYTITLQATNQGGSASTTRPITVPAGPPASTCQKPTVNFTWTNSGKTYTYSDSSTVVDAVNCPITGWSWTFTDLAGLKSNAQNPAAVTYGDNSAHPVTLEVTNAGGTSTKTLNS